MRWMYYNPENIAYLDKLKAHSGFSDLPMLEKLVLDFEMHYHLKDKFDMVVRGGMAALVHTGPRLHRVSEDIDVMTTVSKARVTSIIEKLSMGDGEVNIRIEGEPTRLPDHLIHCEIKCPSSTFQDYCRAKIDILCGIDPALLQYSTTMRSPTLETLKLEHDMDILSRGALIADKMCTLTSAETIGLRNLKNFPKQVHDIAMLLRGASLDDLQTLFKAYGHLASFMLDIHHQTCTTRDLIDSTHDRCVSLFDFREGVLLSPEYQKFYTKFQLRYVKNRRVHTEIHHVDEILLAILCARHLQEHAADGDLNGHSKEIHDAICGYVQVRDAGGSPTPNLGALARISETHPNLAGLRAPLTQAQWMLLLEAFAPLLA